MGKYSIFLGETGSSVRVKMSVIQTRVAWRPDDVKNTSCTLCCVEPISHDQRVQVTGNCCFVQRHESRQQHGTNSGSETGSKPENETHTPAIPFLSRSGVSELM